jgi:hypothetical protein
MGTALTPRLKLQTSPRHPNDPDGRTYLHGEHQSYKLCPFSAQGDCTVLRALMLRVACVLSSWVIVHILFSFHPVSNEGDLLGGVWAVAAVVVVYRDSQAKSRVVSCRASSSNL